MVGIISNSLLTSHLKACSEWFPKLCFKSCENSFEISSETCWNPFYNLVTDNTRRVQVWSVLIFVFLTGLALIKFQVEEYHTTCTTDTTLYWCSLSLCSSCFSVIAWRSIPDEKRSLPTCPVDCWSVGEAIMSRLRRRLAPTLVRARRSPRRRSLRWGLAIGRWP